MLRNHMTQLYYGNMLQNHITGIQFETTQRSLGRPQVLLRACGPTQGPPENSMDKKAMSQQIYCARTILLLHLPLTLQRNCPMTPLDRFIMYASRTAPFFVGHSGELRGDSMLRTPHWGKESAHRAPRPGSPVCIRYIQVYIICIHVYIHI